MIKILRYILKNFDDSSSKTKHDSSNNNRGFELFNKGTDLSFLQEVFDKAGITKIVLSYIRINNEFEFILEAISLMNMLLKGGNLKVSNICEFLLEV